MSDTHRVSFGKDFLRISFVCVRKESRQPVKLLADRWFAACNGWLCLWVSKEKKKELVLILIFQSKILGMCCVLFNNLHKE